MLTQDQIDAYHRDGYVKVKGLFTADQSAGLAADMVRIIEEWGEQTIGWKGPWRDRYLPEEDRLNTRAVFLHRPDFYSAVWSRVIHHEKLVACVRDLIGDSVQWHHTVLHAKPPEMGTPFPMHQDYPFYPHDGANFVDCLLHLDDAPLESGALHVVPGSHKGGPIDHVLGPDTAPHLPPDEYHPDRLASVAVPAETGDVTFFSYLTIHWSDVNRTDQWRKAVRIGYHDTAMYPVGRAADDPHRIDYDNILPRNNSVIVSGFRPKREENRIGAVGSVQARPVVRPVVRPVAASE